MHSAFLQIDAHFGSVNDLAFSHPNKQLCVVTCGNDKLVKVRARKRASVFNFVKLDVFFLFSEIERNLTGMGFGWKNSFLL